MATLTLRGIDEVTARTLKEKAKSEGVSVNSLLLSLIRRGMNIGKQKRPTLHQDLDGLAGTWTRSDVAEFEERVAILETIDESLWT
jgi:hypothetical protein